MRQAALFLFIVWVLAVAALFFVLSAAFGASLITANAALLFASIPYVAWLMFPLAAHAYLRDRGRD
jgi:hypothetical protein